MIYNVAQLLKEGIGAERRYTIEGTLGDIDDLNRDERAIGGRVCVVRTLDGVLASGEAQLALKMVCRRCLEMFENAVKLEFEEEFWSGVDILTGASLPMPEGQDHDLVIGEQHQLDLREVLRQYALMATVSDALCSEACRGLCTQCGQNLNHGECDCDSTSIDPRFSALASLLDEDHES